MNTAVNPVVSALVPYLPQIVGTLVLALVGWLVSEAARYVGSVRANKSASAFQQELAGFIAMAVSGAAKAIPDGPTCADLVVNAVHERYPTLLQTIPDSTLRLMVENAVANFQFATQAGKFTPPTQVSLNVEHLLPQSVVASVNARANPARVLTAQPLSVVQPTGASASTANPLSAGAEQPSPAGWVGGGGAAPEAPASEPLHPTT